ncbi:MAG: DM13 domain-containing protein [Ilumatobacter sp.]|uniref:DM13 domain-containing protein n=1 Tax=Ilumatobacter sp. TaxID=1967498 RepID=UPI002630D1B5|nr:DM13 domain-containing protein [Ilumatobacter sp.]MDJ0771732.1 DM13 domain-containing protein [Ilumatobacter sp.]
MITETPTSPATGRDGDAAPDSPVRTLIDRITRLELVIGAVIAATMLVLVLIEPDILEAPFENERTLLFTVGGTALAAIAFVAMLWFRVPSIVRVTVLVVPFVIVNWWLLSPYFIDDVVDEEFSTSIAAQVATADDTPATPAAPTAPAVQTETEAPTPADDAAPSDQPAQDEQTTPATEPATQDEPVSEEPVEAAAPAEEETPPPPSGPVLLGAGQFVGLAGHDGTGDAGIFQNPDGSLVLRFENFDIENGPDLEVYLVPGADQVSLPEGSIHLGALKGNIGDQNYELPPGTELATGAYTALVWCEAFSVEFVGATIVV